MIRLKTQAHDQVKLLSSKSYGVLIILIRFIIQKLILAEYLIMGLVIHMNVLDLTELTTNLIFFPESRSYRLSGFPTYYTTISGVWPFFTFSLAVIFQ